MRHASLVLRAALPAALASLLLARAADAQTLPSIDGRTWRPSTDGAAQLVLEPVAMPGPGVFATGGWLSYALHPFTLRQSGTDSVAYRPLDHALLADLTASVGIGESAAVGVAIPMAIDQDGSTATPPTILTTGRVPSTALGDVALHGKVTLIKQKELGGFGLMTMGVFTLPTGDRASFLGEGSSTAAARVVADYKYVVAHVQASLGYRLRTEHRTWPDASVGGVTFGDEIPWSFGVGLDGGLFKSFDPDNRHKLELAVHGSLPAGPVGPFGIGDPGSARLSPVLLAASDRIEIGHYHDLYVLGGVDIGLNDAAGVPALRVIAGLGWTPREHDEDHDGVADDRDQCIGLPEDRDSVQDDDGCPEDDADDDGIPDEKDACPLVKGFFSPDPKKNGCPAPDADGDGVPDLLDACPSVKGEANDDPKLNGCPPPPPPDPLAADGDHDGVPDPLDACPAAPGEPNGDKTKNGCPNPDHDGDGIPDVVDACPAEKGAASTDPRRYGCANPDRDGDTYADAEDGCPEQAEVFNGVKDEDGCPDTGGQMLVTIDEKRVVHLTKPPALPLAGAAFDKHAASFMTLRALAVELNGHFDWAAAIGVRPASPKDDAQRDAEARATQVATEIAGLTFRGNAAEPVSWDVVKQQPGSAAAGFGILILVSPAQPGATTPLPEVHP